MKNIFLYLVAVALSLSCFSCDDDEMQEVITIGDASSIYISSEAGRREIPLEATCAWTVERDSLTRQWINIERKNGDGNGSFNLVWRANESFPRKGRVIVKLANKVKADTLYVYQYGVSPSIIFPDKQAKVAAVGKELEVTLNTNIPATDSTRVTMTVDYDKGEGWISGSVFNEDMTKVQLKVAANEPEVGERNAIVHFTYVDAWGDTHTSDLNIGQMEMGGTKQTETISFAEARKLVADASEIQNIDKDIAIEGVILNDNTGENNAANPQINANNCDMTVNNRTAYIQSTDGKYGFALFFDEKELNEFKRYDKVKVWLKGLTITKAEAPERYTITGMTLKNFISKVEGTETDVVKKERTMAELSDNDVYTFVTLKNCEFPIHKGSFTPANEGYGLAYNAYRFDTYPLLMHDNQGQSMFLMTNMSCSYRRDGKTLPQGSGTVAGIIVHEKYTRFEKDGNIGFYQMRHMSREDIKLDQSKDNGFSTIIAEWSKHNLSGSVEKASYGSGEMWHTAQTPAANADYSSVGPITGVQAEDNKGMVSNAAIAAKSWWNNGAPESWIIKVSTKGIVASHLSMALATVNWNLGAPRYWNVEWSEHGETGGEWNHVDSYTCPDLVQWSPTQYEQVPGWKNINVELPLEMLDKSEVYIRLVPSVNKAGTTKSPWSYDGGTIQGGRNNTIPYLSIRYNK